MIGPALFGRWTKGSHWTRRSGGGAERLPADFEATVMELETPDRFHSKQGRSTARVRFDHPQGVVSAYLKRHYRFSTSEKLFALLKPGHGHSPAALEWNHIETAAALGVAVAKPLAAGESIGPGGRVRSYLLIEELVGQEAVNEALPKLAASLDREAFRSLKRRLVREIAAATALLHSRYYFHKDLYLCHFFIHMDRLDALDARVTLIDFHRLARHTWLASRWRSKDLGQLLFSTYAVAEINNRDRLRFLAHYRRAVGLEAPRAHAGLALWRARRYLDHNTRRG